MAATFNLQQEVNFWCEQHVFSLRYLLPDVFLADLKVIWFSFCDIKTDFKTLKQISLTFLISPKEIVLFTQDSHSSGYKYSISHDLKVKQKNNYFSIPQ